MPIAHFILDVKQQSINQSIDRTNSIHYCYENRVHKDVNLFQNTNSYHAILTFKRIDLIP
jgi:hypothetical protein